jgi:hypothetical protein
MCWNVNPKKMQGTTLLEACISFSLVLLVVLGCLNSFQIAIKVQKTIQAKTWVLTQLESLADNLKKLSWGESPADLFKSMERHLQTRLPGSRLSYGPASTEQEYQVNCVWTLGGRQQQIAFSVVLPDLH